jgi:signal transduction histidine kinase
MIKYDKSLPKSITNNISEIHLAGEHLLNLINDVLDLATIETGNIELHLEWCNIDTAIRQASSLVKPLADKHPDHNYNHLLFYWSLITAIQKDVSMLINVV